MILYQNFRVAALAAALSGPTAADTPEHLWSRSYGSPGGDAGGSVSATSDGGALVTGYVFGTVDFGGGPLTSAGLEDIFVLKLDSSGNHVWSRRYGSVSPDYGSGVSAIADGGALVTGFFRGTVDFGGGPLNSAEGSEDIFVLKLGSSGIHVWSRRYGSVGPDHGSGVSATSDGGALVTGYFRNTVDFGGGPLTSAGSWDIFVLRLGSSGNHVWSRRYGSVSNDRGHGASATSDGGALVTGYFRGTVDFGGGPLNSAGLLDIFVLKLDSSGNHVWSRGYGSVHIDQGRGVSATSDGGALVTGVFQGTVDFGGGPLTSAGADDIFVLKLDSSGKHVWSRRYGHQEDFGWSVSATSDGGALVTGSFEGTVDFGGGPLARAGFDDIFVLKLDSSGNHVWSRGYGSVHIDQGRGVSATSDGGALVTGFFRGTVDFGGGPLTSAPASTSSCCAGTDIFVLKLGTSCPRGSPFTSCRIIASAGILFGERFSVEADRIQLPAGEPYPYDSTLVTVTRTPGDLFYLSSSPDSLAPLVCDDAVYLNDVVGGLGPYATIDPNFPICVPIDSILEPLPAHDITELVPWGTNCIEFKLADTQRTIYGNTAVYLVNVYDATGVEPVSVEHGVRLQVLPNPSTNSTTFRLTTSRSGRYGLSICDVTGRTIRRFLDATVPSGHLWRWDGRDADGVPVSAGTYFYVLKGVGDTSRGRFVLLR
jgi:hypothetical protein